ncbi:MAG: FAD-dependent oxidoreductase, partial [Solirubrobacteraceae bacterium]
DVAFTGIVGTSLVKVFDLQVGITGIGEGQGRSRGMDVAAITIDAPDVAPYYPGSRATTVKLTADAQTGRLLGGQVLGRSGVSGRTNVIATALHARMTVDELAAVDLGYAPPFAPVWDPVLIAANQLRKHTS